MTNPLLKKLLEKRNDRKTMLVLSAIGFFLCLLLLIAIFSGKRHEGINKAVEAAPKLEAFQKIAEFDQSAVSDAISDLQTNSALEGKALEDLKKENKTLSDKLEAIKNLKVPQDETQHPQRLNSPDKISEPASLPSSNALSSQNLKALGASLPEGSPINSLRPGIADFSFTYDRGDKAETLPDCPPKDCVLPGTFARAVMLGAADANASVNGQSNTTPILFRVLDQGILPNGYHSHLEGCFVVAEVYGDISSERGEVKLSHISCVLEGRTISKSINGTAYFMGKEGIRGRAIMRNGPLLWNAGIAGILGGLAQGVSQAQQMQSISPLGTTSSIPSGKIASSMGAGGVEAAANTLANYYVKRADQYHPIIELNAGTLVNLVFLSQFVLSSDTAKDNTAVISNQDKQNFQHAKDKGAMDDQELISDKEAQHIQDQIKQSEEEEKSNV